MTEMGCIPRSSDTRICLLTTVYKTTLLLRTLWWFSQDLGDKIQMHLIPARTGCFSKITFSFLRTVCFLLLPGLVCVVPLPTGSLPRYPLLWVRCLLLSCLSIFSLPLILFPSHLNCDAAVSPSPNTYTGTCKRWNVLIAMICIWNWNNFYCQEC